MHEGESNPHTTYYAKGLLRTRVPLTRLARLARSFGLRHPTPLIYDKGPSRTQEGPLHF